MRYAELVTLYFERSTAIQNYWTLYVVVIGGLLAVASLRTHRDVIAGLLATALFCGFAYKNLGAIEEASVTRAAVLDVIKHDGGSTADMAQVAALKTSVEPTLNPPDPAGVRAFHIGCTLATVVTLWMLQWRRTARAPAAA